MNYHAHIYYDDASRAKALEFRELHLNRRSDLNLWVGNLVDRKVGPHPMPMFEVQVQSSSLQAYTKFLEQSRGELGILLHEDTGDDLKDHTQGARWFGPVLELNFGIF